MTEFDVKTMEMFTFASCFLLMASDMISSSIWRVQVLHSRFTFLDASSDSPAKFAVTFQGTLSSVFTSFTLWILFRSMMKSFRLLLIQKLMFQSLTIQEEQLPCLPSAQQTRCSELWPTQSSEWFRWTS